MARSLIQTTNQTTQTVADNGIISLGSVLRRFGCNCKLSGNNAIEIDGMGYYAVDATITVEPSAIGEIQVSLYDNNVAVPGAVAYGYASSANVPVTLPIVTTVRQNCNCNGSSNLTFVLVDGAGDVTNISVRVEKL